MVIVRIERLIRHLHLSSGHINLILAHLNLHAALGKFLCHGGSPVAFLDFQPGGVPEMGSL